MSRFRLQPLPDQERVLLEHWGHARFVWNLAVEQHAHWQAGRKAAPGYTEQCRLDAGAGGEPVVGCRFGDRAAGAEGLRLGDGEFLRQDPPAPDLA